MIEGLESIDSEKSEEFGGTKARSHRPTTRHWHFQQGDDNDASYDDIYKDDKVISLYHFDLDIWTVS